MTFEELRLTLALPGVKPDGAWLKRCLKMLRSEPFGQSLRQSPELLNTLRQALWSFLESHPARSLLSQGDMMLDRSLLNSLGSRLLGKILPPAPRQGSLPDELYVALDQRGDIQWLGANVVELCELFTPPADHPLCKGFAAEIWAALDLVSHRLAAQGLDPEMVHQDSKLEQHRNPFLEQARELGLLSQKPRQEGEDHLRVLLNQCQEVIGKVRRRAHRSGTSVQLTYVLVAGQQSIERMRHLLDLAQGRMSEADRAQFWLQLVQGEIRRHSVRDLMQAHLSIMLWRVTHHSGQTGHHYIAETGRQLKRLFLAAAGGGIVVAAMALVKVQISALHLPLFFQTFLFGLNYALGFILIHLLGFTVATKQPAMTAATLANTLSEDWHTKTVAPDLHGVAEKCWHLLKSQSVAILGNVLLALPVAMLLGWLWFLQFGAAALDVGKANYLFHELDPIHSPALFHAALAGVGLFLAGLFSGYVDNLAAYHAIPERLRHSPLLRRWLKGRAQVWGDYAESESGALAGNVFLGFYLGSLGGLGTILGLHLDIRHVSFASANLGLAWSALPPTQSQLGLALVGTFLIGLTNLCVSFGLTLWLALRARGLDWRALRQLIFHFVQLLRHKTPPT